MHPSPEQNTTTARSHRSQRLLAQACRHSVEGPTEGVSKSDIDEMPAAFAQDHRACGWVRGQDKKPESPCNEMKLLERYEPHGCIAGPPSAPFPPVSKLHETCAGHGHTSPNIDARGPGGAMRQKGLSRFFLPAMDSSSTRLGRMVLPFLHVQGREVCVQRTVFVHSPPMGAGRMISACARAACPDLCVQHSMLVAGGVSCLSLCGWIEPYAQLSASSRSLIRRALSPQGSRLVWCHGLPTHVREGSLPHGPTAERRPEPCTNSPVPARWPHEARGTWPESVRRVHLSCGEDVHAWAFGDPRTQAQVASQTRANSQP